MVRNEEDEERLIRKEVTLQKEVEKLLKTRSSSGYKTKAPQHVQEAHAKKVRGHTFQICHYYSMSNRFQASHIKQLLNVHIWLFISI